MIAILNQIAKLAFKDTRNLLIAGLSITCLWLWYFNPCPVCIDFPDLESTTTIKIDTTINTTDYPEVSSELTLRSVEVIKPSKPVFLPDAPDVDYDSLRLFTYDYNKDTILFEFFSVKALVRGVVKNISVNYKLKPRKDTVITIREFTDRPFPVPDKRLSLSSGFLFRQSKILPSLLLNKSNWTISANYDWAQKKEWDKYSIEIHHKIFIFGRK